MAQFRVGQRVRLLPTPSHPWTDEGTVTGFVHGYAASARRGYVVLVLADHHRSPSRFYGGQWACHPKDLAPLTDPRAEEFIADMERYAHITKTLVKA